MSDCQSFPRIIIFRGLLRNALAVPEFATLHQYSVLSTARFIHTNHMVRTKRAQWHVHANHEVKRRLHILSAPYCAFIWRAEIWCMPLKTTNSEIRLIYIKSASWNKSRLLWNQTSEYGQQTDTNTRSYASFYPIIHRCKTCDLFLVKWEDSDKTEKLLLKCFAFW